MKYYAVTIVGVCLIFSSSCMRIVSVIDSCKAQGFQCLSGQCIDDDLVCDGKADCTDSSDETAQICAKLTCPGFTYTCKYGACVPKRYKCNGVQDCVDNSDEENCSEIKEAGKTNSYASMQSRFKVRKFTCQSGEIIDEDLICDGEPNCADHSDETAKLCSSFHCAYFTYRCDYGACIPLTKKCDGTNNCVDGSDEKKCHASSTSKPERRTTTTQRTVRKAFQCTSGERIDEEYLCDGEPDCADQSDESVVECSKFRCPSFSYKCGYGACVLYGARCNGIKECADNSDEASCSVGIQTFSILVENFKCSSGQTINADLVCDGKADCSDLSDESASTCSQINCPRFTYRCNYGACVHGTARCNGFTECIDNSDEAWCIRHNKTTPSEKDDKLKDYLIFS